jgi:hypothetical protein
MPVSDNRSGMTEGNTSASGGVVGESEQAPNASKTHARFMAYGTGGPAQLPHAT